MELKLSLDQATIGPSVAEVFSSLTTEDRKELSRQILKEFLTEPHNGERQNHEAAIIAELKQRLGDGRTRSTWNSISWKTMTDAQVRDTEEFSSRMNNWRSTRDVMIAEITKVAAETYRESVREFVKTDPQLQEALKITLDAVKSDFPKFVHDAMVNWFITNMQQQSSNMFSVMAQAGEAKMLAETINQRLMSRGV